MGITTANPCPVLFPETIRENKIVLHFPGHLSHLLVVTGGRQCNSPKPPTFIMDKFHLREAAIVRLN